MIRLEYENGMPHLYQHLTNLAKASAALPMIEAATARSTEELQSRVFLTHFYDGKNQQVKIFDSYLHKDFFRSKQKFFCPECLAKTGHMHAAWEFECINSCPIHGRYLIYKCTACSSPQRWHCGGLFACRCHADLREMIAPEAPKATLLLDALAAELVSPSEESRAMLLDAELLSLIHNDDEALSKKMEFLFQNFYAADEDYEVFAVRRWLLPLGYAMRQKTADALEDIKEAEKARARNVARDKQYDFVQVANHTSETREAKLTHRQERRDAITEILESSLFQTMLYSYRLDSERAEMHFWYRWHWFMDRLRFIKN